MLNVCYKPKSYLNTSLYMIEVPDAKMVVGVHIRQLLTWTGLPRGVNRSDFGKKKKKEMTSDGSFGCCSW